LKRDREPGASEEKPNLENVVQKVGLSGKQLSKEERDRILMPPPPPLNKKPKSTAAVTPNKDKALGTDKVAVRAESDMAPSIDVDAFNRRMEMEVDLNGVPEDFFEAESKKAKAQLEKERISQRTDAEYLRFQKEMEASLEAMTEKEALEEEESEQHRQETEDYEQDQRLQLVQRIKQQRETQTASDHVSTIPAGEQNAEMDVSSSSSEEDMAEIQWRGKAL